ncbi:MAG: glycosyltransferase, partial [Rhodothermales bacterium]|nr:glycosyltransferase [Rhodothermales bacterium]
LPVYYGRAGGFVHPAHNDQWGLVVNEAMAAGLPVLVSTRAGCAQDLVHDGENGFRFDPADPAALARLLARLAAPETDRAAMGRRSREIIARWSPERFAEGLHRAAEAGRDRARRGLHPAVAALLHALRLTARSTDSFHTVRDA